MVLNMLNKNNDYSCLYSAMAEASTPIEQNEAKLFFDEGEGNVFIVNSGSANLMRKSDGLIVHTFYKYEIVGFVDIFNPSGKHYLQQVAGAKISKVSRLQALSIIESKNLWEMLAKYFSRHLLLMIDRDDNVFRRNAKEIVHNCLIEIDQLDKEMKEEVNVVNYICSRSVFSASAVNAVLRELKRKELIVINNGRLITINHLAKS